MKRIREEVRALNRDARNARNAPRNLEQKVQASDFDVLVGYLALVDFEQRMEVHVAKVSYNESTIVFGQRFSQNMAEKDQEHKQRQLDEGVEEKKCETKFWSSKIKDSKSDFSIIKKFRDWYFHGDATAFDIRRAVKCMHDRLVVLDGFNQFQWDRPRPTADDLKW